MSRSWSKLLLPLLLAATLAVIGLASISNGPRAGATTTEPEPALADMAAALACLELPEVSSDLPPLPADAVNGGLADQNSFNCFAWQQFIALNWWADPAAAGQPDLGRDASQFGDPSLAGDTVWETYKEAYEVFLPNAETPTGWGEDRAVPQVCVDLPDGLLPDDESPILNEDSKFSDGQQVLDEVGQATGLTADPNAFLVAQNGTKVRYNVLMNEVEFDYIVENEFYNSLKQYEAVQEALTNGGPGIYVPESTETETGAIELKAAWVQLDDPNLWPYYVTTEAFVYDDTDPEKPTCFKAVMGLVGLHIIAKATSQWTWTTFEHIANAPSIDDIRALDLLPAYRFYNHDCQTNCLPNRQPKPGDPGDRPIQVVRTNAIEDQDLPEPLDNDVASLNAYVQELIRETNADSVFQYYELVGIAWPLTDFVNDKPTQELLPYENIVPQTLANTTIETYFQQPGMNCVQCHTAASIAPSSADEKPKWRSDYSFLFGRAQEPPAEDGGGGSETAGE